MEDAVIVAVSGDVWIKDADGNLTVAEVGDRLEEGCVLVTGPTGMARIDWGKEGELLLVDANQKLSIPFGQGDGSDFQSGEPLEGERLDHLLQALDGGGSNDADIFPQSGSPGGVGDGNEGHEFVRLLRIVEEITPLKYQFGPLPPDEVLPRAGGANSHDGDLQDDRLAGAPDDIPTTPDSDGDPATLTPQGLLDEDGLPKGIAGGPGDAPGTEVVITGCLDYDFGDDGPAASGAFSWTTEGLPVLTSQGETVSWTVSDDGLTLSGVDESGEPVLTVTVTDPANGEYEAELHQGLDHSDPTTEDDIVLTLGYEVTDGDGDTAKGSLVLTVDDDRPVIEATVDDDAASMVEGGTQGGSWSGGVGADEGNVVIRIPGVTDAFALGEEIATGTGTLVVAPDGTWSFTAKEGLDQSQDPCLEFTIEGIDSEGDSARSSIKVVITDGAGPATPDSDGDPSTESVSVAVNEDGLPTGNAGGEGDLESSSDSASANLGFDYGADGAAEQGAFRWELDGLPELTSRDSPVEFVVSSDGYTVMGNDADGERVLTINLADAETGDVVVYLSKDVDHPEGGQENDLALELGYTITDKDGSTASGTLEVVINDDTPTITGIDPESFMAAMGGATRAAALPLLAEEDELAWNLGEPASSADISHATAVDASGNMLDLRELLEDIDDLEGGEKVLAIADGDDTVVHVKLDGGLLQDGSNADVQVTLTGVSMDGSSDDFLVKLLESSQSDIE
ncbi:DUF5801 repeats-in-toxin domain-containing protein [uncultured Halomonas sp.]|uniref:DUF5801 repeats-in-toxin domain-containing protein n=1 Tax=uncultured Halomonas sp. TaxID=173971 RepID=UPI002593D0D5|nr:DUF5801 repeats-in-toxin domain-containing protein [uncultured Halomonas sp.]